MGCCDVDTGNVSDAFAPQSKVRWPQALQRPSCERIKAVLPGSEVASSRAWEPGEEAQALHLHKCCSCSTLMCAQRLAAQAPPQRPLPQRPAHLPPLPLQVLARRCEGGCDYCCTVGSDGHASMSSRWRWLPERLHMHEVSSGPSIDPAFLSESYWATQAISLLRR